MKDLIGFCGIDCEKCDAFLATLNDDDVLREKTAKLWAELNQAPILPAHINCQGCRIDGVKTFFCDELCTVRKCATEKDVVTCGACGEREVCRTLRAVTDHSPDAKENLKFWEEQNEV